MIKNLPRNFTRKGSELFLSDTPIAFHCHHYNINLQKTLETYLGGDGPLLISQAAEESSYSSFASFLKRHSQITSDKSKLELASISYQSCGLGIINLIKLTPEGGSVASSHSHHATGWLAKFGKKQTPGCYFTRGWIAGVLAVIYNRQVGYYSVDELECKMTLAKQCVFEVTIV